MADRYTAGGNLKGRSSAGRCSLRGTIAIRFTLAAALLLCLTCLKMPGLRAEEMGEFSFEILPDGTPSFTQVLRWEGDPNVLYYEILVQTSAGKVVSASKVGKPELRLNLKPGEYRYRIVLYNLLGKRELDLPWHDFTVRKAKSPHVSELSPRVWFLEDLKPQLTLSGVDLVPGATIVLKSKDKKEKPLLGKVVEQKGTTEVLVEFPPESVTIKEYSLEWTNPGGLSCIIPRALPVRYYRPVDMVITAGYAPWVSLYDSWYTQTWSETFFPLSFVNRVSLFFIKSSYGFFGGEITIGGRLMTGGVEGVAIDSQTGLIGFSPVYKYGFTKRLFVTVRAGGGLSFNHYAFDYTYANSAEVSSIDPYMWAGFSFQFYFTKRIFLETGTDWMHILGNDFSGGGVMPMLCIGILL